MLTFNPNPPRSVAPTHEKPLLLLLLALAWLFPGVFSHDLWKPAEPWVNEAVKNVLAGGSPWQPVIVDTHYFATPPIYIAVAAKLRLWLSPWLTDAYSAMRLTSVMFTAIGLTACGMAGFRLLGRHQGRSVVLILIGCAGLIMAGHFLGGMSVQFAALGLCLSGLSLAQKQVIKAVFLLSTGWILLSLSAGYLLTFALILMAFLLFFHHTWHKRRYLVVLMSAFIVAVPLMIAYPMSLYRTEPQAFFGWWNHHAFGTFGGWQTFSLSFHAFYYVKNILWFAFPALPLAIWTLTRQGWRDSAGCVLAVFWLVMCTLVLAFEPSTYQENLIWLLPPLALLGAAKLDDLRRGAASFLNWFGIMTFGLSAVFLWLGFFAMNFGFPAKLAERAAYFSPYFVPDIDAMPIIVASLFTPLWLWAVTRKHVKGRQAVTNWAAGITLVWALLMTLFLPWIDAAKSFRPVVLQMQAAAPEDLYSGKTCLAISRQDATARAAWREYSRFNISSNHEQCRYRLLQSPQQLPDGWQALWRGARPRNKTEFFVLIGKNHD